ncbi:MAG: hypothetical protein ACLRYM_06010 [Thomasclavelia ramosa]
MWKKIIIVFVSSILMLPFVSFNVYASEVYDISKLTEKALNTEEMNELFYNFLELGIEKTTAVKLVEKYNNGILPDSVNPDFEGKTETEEDVQLFQIVTRTVYPDGSVKQTTTPRTPDEVPSIMPMSVTGGEYRSGSGWWTWYDAKCEENQGVIKASFRINASGGVGSYATILKAYDPLIKVVGGSYYDEKLTHVSKFEARLDFLANYHNASYASHRLKVTTSGYYEIKTSMS